MVIVKLKGVPLMRVKNTKCKGPPGQSSGRNPMLLLPRAQVQSLVGEIRPWKLSSTAKNKTKELEKKKRKKIQINNAKFTVFEIQ